MSNSSEQDNGHFTPDQVNFIKKNQEMTDADIARTLNRKTQSIKNKRTALGIKGDRSKRSTLKENRSVYINSLDEKGKKEEFQREVRNSARYKGLINAFTGSELDQYVEKYIDFMMDPTIETMTTMEKDSLHQVFVNEIRINRFLEEEKNDKELAKKEKRMPISRAREIRECQELILKAHKSLDVEREQRLKSQSDQAVTFTNLIRDLKNPNTRLKAGREAAMLKYIAEKFYNEKLGDNIVSGRDEKFDLDALFKNKKAPDLSADFTPKKNVASGDDNGITNNSEGFEGKA